MSLLKYFIVAITWAQVVYQIYPEGHRQRVDHVTTHFEIVHD